MTIETWLTFIMACLVFSSTPGIGILSTVNHAISTNAKYTAFSILGLELALAIYVLVVSVGLNAILTESIVLFTVIKLCGAAYLIYFGVQKFFSKSSLQDDSILQTKKPSRKAIRTGMLINFSNPKSIIFLAAFFPQFINPSEGVAQQYFILGVTMLLIDALFHGLYAVFASKVKKYLLSEGSLLVANKILGLLFIGIALLMAKTSVVKL